MIKVAIDTGPLTSGHSVRGIGVHTRLLIEHLEKLNGVKVEAVDFTKTDLSKFDVAHYQFFNPFFVNLPLIKKTKTVVTIHDLIPLIYPKHYPPGLKGKIKFNLNKFLVKRADAVITISETSKKDIVRFLGIRPEKIHVVYLAPKPIYRKIGDQKTLNKAREKYGLPDKFVLYVGDVNYNKNIPTLIKACEIADIPLVIAGKQAMDIETQGMGINDIKGLKDWFRFVLNKPHPELAHFKQILKAFDKSKNIKRLGFVPDEDLVAIYNLASIYCQPSYYEGYGIPVVDALTCGTPVVASRTQALVEIAGDGAYFADAKKPEDFATKFKRIIEDKKLRNKYIDSGREAVKKYSWQNTAQGTLAVYESLAK
ncbi:MAG TPA: glycosyltransferase family 1 protein [Patescibacteria group bacterium]